MTASKTRLCVKNLNKICTPEQVKEYFSKYGTVTDVKIKYREPKKLTRKEKKALKFESKQKAEGENENDNEEDQKIEEKMADKQKHDKDLSRGMGFIGFSNPQEAEKAITALNKSFWKNHRLQVEYAEDFRQIIKRKSDQNSNQNSDDQPAEKKTKSSDLSFLKSKMKNFSSSHDELSNINIGETGRLMIRNLAYSVTEEHLENLFKQFGDLTELNLIIDESTGKNKGFGFVTFVFPENALEAYEQLDGSEFQGRLIHILPAKAAKGNTSGMLAAEKNKKISSFKKRQLEKQLEKDNAVSGVEAENRPEYISTSNVAEIVANEHGISKTDIALDSKFKDENSKEKLSAAVRLAIAETSLIAADAENTDSSKKESTEKSSNERSRNTLIIKNIPVASSEEKIRSFFSSFGSIAECSYNQKKLSCIIEYDMSRAAKRCCKNIRSRDKNPLGKGPPLLIDWASKYWKDEPEKDESAMEDTKSEKTTKIEDEAYFPSAEENMKSTENIKEEVEEEIEEKGPIPEDSTTIYIKNLNFDTIEENLNNHFSKFGKIYKSKICRKHNKKLNCEQSMGYGFIQFYKKYDCNKAIRKLQRSDLDNHTIELKQANTSLYVAKNSNKSSSGGDKDDEKANNLYEDAEDKMGGGCRKKVLVLLFFFSFLIGSYSVRIFGVISRPIKISMI